MNQGDVVKIMEKKKWYQLKLNQFSGITHVTPMVDSVLCNIEKRQYIEIDTCDVGRRRM